MVYRSKAEIEDDLWMTDDEALDHIQTVDRCDRETARDQLEKLKGDAPDIVRRIVFPLGPAGWIPSEVIIPRQVRRRDIERVWPRLLATGTGAPGRPSKSMHLIEREFERRKDAGEVLPQLAAEARHLLTWLPHAHPDAEPPTEKTIKNRLRDAHRDWRERMNPEAEPETGPKRDPKQARNRPGPAKGGPKIGLK
jgi:hypothetical protein